MILNLADVKRLAAKKLTAAEALLYLYLRCLENKGRAWPAMGTMKEDLILSERTLRRCLSSLEKKGAISQAPTGLNKGRMVILESGFFDQKRTGMSGQGCPTADRDVRKTDRAVRPALHNNDLIYPKEKNSGATKLETVPPVPKELVGLELYEKDLKACKRLPEMLPVWKSTYPAVNIPDLIRRLHAWEMAVPVQERKKDRIRFFHNRIAAEQERADRRGTWKPPWEKNQDDYEKRLIKKMGELDGHTSAKKA